MPELPNIDYTPPTSTATGPRVAKAAKDKPKPKTIELSISAKEVDAFIGDNPTRKKLRPELVAAVRAVGERAAVEAVAGKVQDIWATITK